VEHGESFEVQSATGRRLIHVYFEDEPGRRDVMKRIAREDAKRLAAQIMRSPDLLDELKKLRAAFAANPGQSRNCPIRSSRAASSQPASPT
jgi:hypothetical protein